MDDVDSRLTKETFYVPCYSDQTDNSKKILKIMIRVSAYPQISMILTNPGYQSTIVEYILGTFDRKGKNRIFDGDSKEPHDVFITDALTILSLPLFKRS